MSKLKIDKKEGALYGILLVIPFGIPVLITIILVKKMRKRLTGKKDIRTFG